jgi:ATP-binding cassette subfamily B protein
MSGGIIAQFVLTGALVAGAFGSLTEVWRSGARAGAASRLNELLNERPRSRRPPDRAAQPGARADQLWA